MGRKRKRNSVNKLAAQPGMNFEFNGVSRCGANAGALMIETKLTQRVVEMLKAANWYPENYREPPPRRTKVLWVETLQGRFGNPDIIAPLLTSSLKESRVVPVIEPGTSALTAYINNNVVHSREVSREVADCLPAELRVLLDEGRASWRPQLRIPTSQELVWGSNEGKKEKSPVPVNIVTQKKKQFRFIELFAGLGGFRLGLESLGGTCVFASEIDNRAKAIYSLNFSDSSSKKKSILAGDITKVRSVDIPEHDMLVAGFPCQPFSTLGDQPGFKDTKGKGSLFLEITRILNDHMPKCFLLENVPGLLHCSTGTNSKEIDSNSKKNKDSNLHENATTTIGLPVKGNSSDSVAMATVGGAMREIVLSLKNAGYYVHFHHY